MAGFIAVTSAEGAVGKVVNLGTGRGITIEALAKTILKLMGSNAELVVEDVRVRPELSEVMELVCDPSLARSLSGWTATYSLEAGLQETIAWMRDNLHRYKPEFYNI